MKVIMNPSDTDIYSKINDNTNTPCDNGPAPCLSDDGYGSRVPCGSLKNKV